MSDDNEDFEPDTGLAGPALWRNWRAYDIGQPACTESSTEGSALVRPSWQEFSLWSDTYFSMAGDGQYGPFLVLLGFASPDGTAKQALVLRAHDHLLPAPVQELERVAERDELDGYAGGGIGDQFAALLSLALARRLRNAGVTRLGFDDDEVGRPQEPWGRQPFLPRSATLPMLPGVTAPARLDDANPLLQHYAQLSAEDALAVQRAANQFADALWWAEADPRISWIKLFGAVEAAAEVWDRDFHVDAVEQLKTRHEVLAGKLAKHHPDALPLVAEQIAQSIGAESKMREFLLAYLPEPPEVRPTSGQLSFEPESIRQSLRVLYQHRSNELHRGIPIPPPLCLPPHPVDDGTPAEVVFGLAVSAEGGSWPASSFPMTLASFAHLVGGALRAWWLALPTDEAWPEPTSEGPSTIGPDG